MYRCSLFIFFLFFNVILFSQKGEVIYKSNISHNYAIGNHFYIENTIDTNKLLFMGTIKIISSNQDDFISRAHNLLVMKCKDLNANSYKIKSFSTIDTTLTFIFDVYFAGDNQIQLIKNSRIKNKFIYFNNIKDTIFRTIFLNDVGYLFLRKKHLEVSNVVNRKVCFKLDTTNRESKCKTMKTGTDAYFYSVKIKENQGIYIIPVGLAPILIVATVAYTASGLANKYINPNQEKITNIDYNLGRILMEIYPLDKQVILD